MKKLKLVQRRIENIQVVFDQCKSKRDLIFEKYPKERENGIEEQSVINEQR